MGRVFSKRLYRFIAGVSSAFNFVHITSELREALLAWCRFLLTFNGCTMWQVPFCSTSTLNLLMLQRLLVLVFSGKDIGQMTVGLNLGETKI